MHQTKPTPWRGLVQQRLDLPMFREMVAQADAR